MHRWEGARGVTLAGDSWGDPDGPLVLLQHGGGQTRHAWKGAGETLGAAGYHAVAFDARGHGDSDWAPDGAYGQDVMVEDLACLVAALGDKRPVLVGASMGGGTSLVAVGEDHVDATALVLVDIAPRIELDGVKKIQAFMSQKPEGFESLDEVADAIAGLPAPPHPAPQPRRPGQERPPRRRRPVPLALGPEVPLRAPRRDASARPGWRRAPATSPCPRCSCGAGSPTSSARRARRASSALCPHSEYVNVSGAAHMVAGDRNDIFAAAVIEFLSRAVPVDGTPRAAAARAAPPSRGPDRRHPRRALTAAALSDSANAFTFGACDLRRAGSVARDDRGMQTPTIISGDVIEFDGPAGATTALVLLVSDTTLVLDLLDGATPRVVKTMELHGVRVFDPADTLLEAA